MTNENTQNPESWENLTLANNFLFCKIMESEPELCRQLLELLLHIKIDHLEVPQAEKTMKETLDSKSVRFDVYTKDDNRIFDRAFKLFFNASNYDKLANNDEKSFFKFLRGEDATTDFTKNLKDKLSLAKKNAEWRMQYMTWEQTIKHERKVVRQVRRMIGADYSISLHIPTIFVRDGNLRL